MPFKVRKLDVCGRPLFANPVTNIYLKTHFQHCITCLLENLAMKNYFGHAVLSVGFFKTVLQNSLMPTL